MSTLSSEAWQIFGGLVAAIVAGLVSFLITILTKEQKTSEFRQVWIDALRQDLSDYAAASIYISDSIWVQENRPSTATSIQEHLISAHQQQILQIECTRIRILLRLNPKEHLKLIDLIDRAYQHGAKQEDRTDVSFGSKIITEFIAESQTVLKREWKRVKRGEWSFIAAKILSLLVVVCGCVAGYFYWNGRFF